MVLSQDITSARSPTNNVNENWPPYPNRIFSISAVLCCTGRPRNELAYVQSLACDDSFGTRFTPIMITRVSAIFAFGLILWAGVHPLVAAITYVDATIANTTLSGATLTPGVNFTSGGEVGAMDNLWHFRTNGGNGGSVWTADEGSDGAENVQSLVTTVTFPAAGAYRIFVYVWDSQEGEHDWDARVRLGSAGVYSRVLASEAEPAVSARFNSPLVVEEGLRRLIQIPIGIAIVAKGGNAQVCVDDDLTTDLNRSWYDGVGYEKAFEDLAGRIIALDFNKSNAPAAPSQALFRSVRGSTATFQNSTNIVKHVGPYSVQLTKSSPLPFDFRGANGDGSRNIPGGPTSLSFLVADFIGARDGTINIGISNLASGTYLFRSYHLDTFNSSNFGFAQGTSSTTQNTLRAQVGGVLEGIVQPTVLGSVGLATNFISNVDIPTLSFPFVSDGSNAVKIQLSTVYTNGADRYVFMNGFEVFHTTP